MLLSEKGDFIGAFVTEFKFTLLAAWKVKVQC